jgi:uncharacterized UPF0146 family protein
MDGTEAIVNGSKPSFMLRGAAEMADFILRNYSGKVVEVGVGFVPEVAMLLSRKIAVVATDKETRQLDGLCIAKDDIFSPQEELYEGASLLYSIRPPIEVQLAMGRLAAEIGADVLIRPLEDEIAKLPGFSRTLVNLGDARFYSFRPARKFAAATSSCKD